MPYSRQFGPIQIRRDTNLNFSTVNPVLLSGEMSYTTDTNIFKIGDGTTAWNNLSALNFNSPEKSIYNIGNVGGSVSLNWGIDRQIQTFTLNGVACTFNLGTGWPTNSVELNLYLDVLSSTDTSWPIVNDNWYVKPPSSTFSTGKYLIKLLKLGSGIISGQYIGTKSGTL